jgi:O-antigen ligase
MNDPAHNPYSAPKAGLAEAVDVAGPRPRVIGIAVVLLWIDLALGLISTLIDIMWVDRLQVQGLVFALGWAAAWTALFAFLNFRIWAGQRWARTMTLVLVILSVLAELGAATESGLSAMKLAFDITGFVLDAVALALLLGPGRAWFDRLD